ncbi:hypothetical protein HGRIS_002286 [Hohenbuehelia grisea]|uniref:Conserved oligomeric Golgi complex subunit 5 n=1 Tax=Hohenbuehelia grisea TaxID=104357 RepID=A0ABR3JK17_9AGAR
MSDYTVFASPTFDANEYANATLAGEPYPPPHTATTQTSGLQPSSAVAVRSQEPPAKEDISSAISKLDTGIDDVSKQIKSLISAHHEDLLSQAATAHDLSGSLTAVRSGLAELDTSMDKLRQKVRSPYTLLQTHATRLQKLQYASDVLRRTARFVILARRLQVQMADMRAAEADLSADGEEGESQGGTDGKKGSKQRPSAARERSLSTMLLTTGPGQDGEDEKERTIAKAALSIAELVSLLDGPSQGKIGDATNTPAAAPDENPAEETVSLRSIHAVAAHIPFIEDARNKVTNEMQSMVLSGLVTLDQSLLASSLQTAFNLRVLPELVQNLVLDLSQAVEDRIRTAFDLSRISKDVNKEPQATASNASQSPPTMYRSRVRTEPTNITAPQFTAALWSRLENMIEEMAGCCIKVYTLEKVLKLKKDAVSQAVFFDEAMKLLENKPSATFWTSLSRALEKHARDAAKSSTFLQQTLGNGYPRLLRLFHDFFAKIAVHTDTVYIHTYQSPETVLILRALSNFESLYLSRSSTKLNEAVGQAFSGGMRNPPGTTEGMNVARTVVNELDSARFDPLLVKAVAKHAATSLDMLLSRVDSLVVKDRSAVTLIGPTATPQQTSNAQLANCLYHCCARLEQLESDHTESVYGVMKPSVINMRRAFQRVVDPVMTSVRRELGAIIAKLHRVDLGKSVDPMSGLGGSSFYMKDLAEKLSFIKSEILSKFNVGETGREWVVDIVKYVIRTFVLHISIAKPLGESGKLQLTSDMTELEFALNAFMIETGQKRGGDLENLGEEYHALRAMRPLLFLDNVQLTSEKATSGLPPLIVLHHILVRSPVPLPHGLHGWQEAEYVRWVDEHSEEEAWTLVEGGLSHWEKIRESEDDGDDSSDAAEYIQLARTVLANAKAGTGSE